MGGPRFHRMAQLLHSSTGPSSEKFGTIAKLVEIHYLMMPSSKYLGISLSSLQTGEPSSPRLKKSSSGGNSASPI